MQGFYVLENKLGQVVRTFHWKGKEMSLVYREDIRRVQPFADVKTLDEQGIKYTVLADVTQDSVKKRAVKLVNGGTLRWQEEIVNMTPTVVAKEENNNEFNMILKRTAATGVALILLLLIGHALVNYFMKKDEEPRIVKIVPRENRIQPPPVVTPSEHKITNTKIARATKVTKPTIHRKDVKRVAKHHPTVAPKFIQPRVAHKSVTKPVESLNSMGALGVLGSTLNKNAHKGGLQVNAVHTTRGAGLGGTGGSGGVQTTMYGKGLVAAPLGAGGKITGGGGIGTHGKGGGQAGYGTMSLVGAGGSYFEPVESEADIEGGLDRDEIAAVIQRHIGQIRFCYEKGLQGSPKMSGRVAIKFLIGGNGVVSTAGVSNTSLHSNNVENCIVGRLKTFKFPQPRGGVVVKVNYPFVLKRVSQG